MYLAILFPRYLKFTKSVYELLQSKEHQCSPLLCFWSLPERFEHPRVPAMAESSMLTMGHTRSLLVDSSVYDSRIVETTKDQGFLGMTSEDGEGEWELTTDARHSSSVFISDAWYFIFLFCITKWRSGLSLRFLSYPLFIIPFVWSGNLQKHWKGRTVNGVCEKVRTPCKLEIYGVAFNRRFRQEGWRHVAKILSMWLLYQPSHAALRCVFLKHLWTYKLEIHDI